MLTITLNNVNVKNNELIPFNKSQFKPIVHVNNLPNKYYSIIAVDPDAPSKLNPKYKYWLHWLIINNNQEIVPYQFPLPPVGSGKHRYCFYLLKQNNKLDKNILNLKKNNSNFIRKNFNLSEFIVDNNLEIMDSVIFKTQR